MYEGIAAALVLSSGKDFPLSIFRVCVCGLFAALTLTLAVAAFRSASPSHSIVNAESEAAVCLLLAVITAPASGTTRKQTVAPLMLWTLPLGMVPYLLTIRTPFLFDDYNLVGNASRQAIMDVLRTSYVHPTGGDRFFRPLGYLDFWIDWHWHGFSFWQWHLTNVVLHLAAVYLLYFLCRRLDVSSAAAFVAALFFALHGANPEVVTWISGRFDEMVTCFCLLILLLLFSYVETGKHYVWMLALCCCALLTKEAAYCIPLLAVCCLWFRGTWNRRAIRALAGLLLTTALMFCYRFWAMGGIGGYQDATGRPTITLFNPLHLGELIAFRAWSVLFFPVNWAMRSEIWLVVAWLIAAISGTLIMYFVRPEKRHVFASIAFALAAIAPASHLALLNATLTNARVYHLALLGGALLVATLFDGMPARRMTIVAFAGILLFQAATLVHNQRIWAQTAYLAGRTCQSFAAATSVSETVTVENLPRVHDGVFFLANGFPDCVWINSGQKRQISKSINSSRKFVWSNNNEVLEQVR